MVIEQRPQKIPNPTFLMSDTTAQSPSVEGIAPEAVEVTTSQPEATPTPTTEAPPTEETPPTGEEPSSNEDVILSDEEVEAIVADMLKDIPTWQVTEPTFFPKKDWDVAADVEALKIVVDQVADATEKAEEAQAKLQETEAKVTELTTFVETVKSAYGNVTTFLGTEIADKIAEWNFDEVPAHLNPENWKKVAEHPFFGPQVEKLLKGEEVDLPNLIKEAIGKRKSLPDITDTPTTNTPSVPVTPTTQQNLIKSLRGLHGL